MLNKRFAHTAFLVVATITFMSSAHAETAAEKEAHDAMAILSNPPADYLICKTRADCVVGYDQCGNPRGINKSHINQYESMAKKIRPTVNCSGPIGPDHRKNVPACKKNICTVE